MQQERSFLRRVSVLKPFINENCPSSRRAYFSIRPAVKTSRPQLNNEIQSANIQYKQSKYSQEIYKFNFLWRQLPNY